MKKPVETEIKLRVGSPAKIRAMLRAHGFRASKPRVFEQNIVLDDAAGSLRRRGMLLRLRGAGKTVTCTFKGPEKAARRHKSREEREFHASSLEAALAVFGGLGYAEVFRYEKYRAEFAKPNEPGLVMLDETPMGNFIELEGPPRWIDRSAKEFGFAIADYVTLSYGALWEEWCKANGKSGDMRFVQPAGWRQVRGRRKRISGHKGRHVGQ